MGSGVGSGAVTAGGWVGGGGGSNRLGAVSGLMAECPGL